MGLSRFLQSEDIFRSIRGKAPSESRALILAKGNEWFQGHPEERELIKKNLARFGLDLSDGLLDRVQENTILHYHEKLLPFSGGPEFFHGFLSDKADTGRAVGLLQNVIGEGRGVILAACHFGAVEFIISSISMRKIPVNALLRFTTEKLSKSAREYARAFTQSGLFGPISFIEVGRPGTNAALEMAAVLRRKELLLTVFDEKTEFSRQVELFGKKVWGGAGIDKLIKFSGGDIAVFSAFMLRTGNGGYRLELTTVDPEKGDPIQQIYGSLQEILSRHLDQWYFLHEDIPFAGPGKGR